MISSNKIRYIKLKKSIFVFAVVFITGCAQWIPARSTELSSGRYSLQSSGNVFASYESLKKIIDKKAVKLCGNEYEYESEGELDNKSQTNYASGMTVSASYKVLTKIVICKKS